jgi:hypothetical protein
VKVRNASVVRLYGLALGAALLLEGGFYLIVTVLKITTSDVPHNTLHVVWGAAILVALLEDRSNARAAVVMLIFGLFYTALAFAGALITNPFGLQLGPGENAFHFTVGPLALALGVWGLNSAAALPTRRSSERTSR